MDTSKYTRKTLEAVQAAQKLAVEYQNQVLEPEHLLAALAGQEQGLIPQLLEGMGVEPASFVAAATEALGALPRVSGSGRDPDKVYISPATDKAVLAAEREAKAMKDEYVSVEHLMLGLLDEPTPSTAKLFSTFGLTKDKFLAQLSAVRGNQRVTSDSPEETYNALKKYGQDLVEMARRQKLDPVIGRDEEIRNVIRILSRKTKNNPCSSASRASARRPSPRGSRSASCAATCPRTSRTARSFQPGHGRAGGGRQIPRRIRGAAQGVLNEVKKSEQWPHPAVHR
jgi:ATP-dependent Clp protease ATP-binding subunit ClpB